MSTWRNAWTLMQRQPFVAVASALLVVSSLLSGAAALMAYQATRDTGAQADEIEGDRLAAAERSCTDAAETRATLREMTREGGVAAGVTSGEALILTVGADADPDAVQAYRDHLTSLLDPALVEIVNELPDRRWDPDTQTCVDVPVEP